MIELLKKLSGPKLWIAYTLLAATLGGILVYIHHENSQAQRHYEIGMYYREVMYEPRARERAVQYLRLAAEGGHTQAQRELGAIYLRRFQKNERAGDGETARRWLAMAADRGDREAGELLALMPPTRSGEPTPD